MHNYAGRPIRMVLGTALSHVAVQQVALHARAIRLPVRAVRERSANANTIFTGSTVSVRVAARIQASEQSVSAGLRDEGDTHRRRNRARHRPRQPFSEARLAPALQYAVFTPLHGS